MKLMIVDDNARMRSMICRNVFGKAETEDVRECEDGLDAVLAYDSFRPDWVVMDIEMRGLDGLAASRIIKQYHPDAKIIIFTQYDDPEYRDMAAGIGVSKYILKDQLVTIKDIVTQ